MTALGLSNVVTNLDYAANTLTAPYYPEGVSGSALLPKIRKAGVILAGGLHPKIKTKYFRIGHMGSTNTNDLLATIGAIETGLAECGYRFELGAGMAAAQKILCG